MNKYRTFNAIEDDRQFGFGEIWKVRDELVSLLPTDRVAVNRRVHRCRLVVITQQCDDNNNPLFPVISVAPLASNIKFLQKYDILLKRNVSAFGIDSDECMIQMQLKQPMLKKDLFEKVGYVAEETKEEIIVIETELIGLEINDDGLE